MLIKFEEIIEVVLHHEGGFTDDSKDPGNWTGGKEGVGELEGTKYGISAKSFPDMDIKNLTKDGAKEIYYQDYWIKNRVPQLPDNLKHIYFDMSINQGRSRAVKILQQAANAKGANLKVDGGLGPKTIGALKGVELDRVRAYRIKYYADLVTRKPDLEKFYFGWFRRGLEV